MTGGVTPLGLVTTKESVRHWVATAALAVAVAVKTPPLVRVAAAEFVLGPVMTKLEKSRRSYEVPIYKYCNS